MSNNRKVKINWIVKLLFWICKIGNYKSECYVIENKPTYKIQAAFGTHRVGHTELHTHTCTHTQQQWKSPNWTHQTQECLSLAPPEAWPSSSLCSHNVCLISHTCTNTYTHAHKYILTWSKSNKSCINYKKNNNTNNKKSNYSQPPGGSLCYKNESDWLKEFFGHVCVSPASSLSICCSRMMSPLWKLSRVLSSVM